MQVISDPGIADDLGNQLASTSFTVSSLPAITDAAAPVIVSFSPANNAISQSRTGNLVIIFSEPMNTGSVVVGSLPVYALTQTWSNNKTLTLSHSPFAPNQNITVTITAAEAIAGSPVNLVVLPYAWSFTTIRVSSTSSINTIPETLNTLIVPPAPSTLLVSPDAINLPESIQSVPEPSSIPLLERPSVIVYQHINFQGRSETFYINDENLLNNDIGNDKISSLRLIGGARAVLFQHKNFGGRKQVFEQDVADLRGSVIGNDIASSVQINGSLSDNEKAPLQCVLSKEIKVKLAIGSKGEAVLALQQLLSCLGYSPSSVVPNGYFGPLTKKAVTQFQSKQGLPPVGIVGPLTLKLLNSMIQPGINNLR